MLELCYFTWAFLVIRIFRGYQYCWPRDLDVGIWPLFWKPFTLLIAVEQWELEFCYFTWVFHVIRPSVSIIVFLPSWSVTHCLKTLTSLITFEKCMLELWYFMWVFYNDTFLGVPTVLNLWHWLQRLTFFKTLAIAITFEQWKTELWFFTWIFLVGRPFGVYQHLFCPVTLIL